MPGIRKWERMVLPFLPNLAGCMPWIHNPFSLGPFLRPISQPLTWNFIFSCLGTISFVLFCLFMAVLGLRFCATAFSSCGKWGPLFIAVRGPLIIVASLVAEHRLQTRRLSNCGSRA